jgi:hypothetical protein
MSEIEVTTKLLLALIDQKDVVAPHYFDSWLIPNVLVGVRHMSLLLCVCRVQNGKINLAVYVWTWFVRYGRTAVVYLAFFV